MYIIICLVFRHHSAFLSYTQYFIHVFSNGPKKNQKQNKKNQKITNIYSINVCIFCNGQVLAKKDNTLIYSSQSLMSGNPEVKLTTVLHFKIWNVKQQFSLFPLGHAQYFLEHATIHSSQSIMSGNPEVFPLGHAQYFS